MRACLLLFVLAILPCGSAFCADPSTWFPELTRLDLKDEGVRVWYPKANAKPVTTPPAYLKDYDDAGVFGAQPLLLDLGHGLPTLALACDSGPSNDPSCRLLRKFDDPASAIFESAGNDFVFLTTAEIYVFGGTDYTYDHRRLFRYDGKHFTEIAQPFRYVGIEGKTKAPLALTSVRSGDAQARRREENPRHIAAGHDPHDSSERRERRQRIRPESGLPRAHARRSGRLGTYSDATGRYDDRRWASLRRRLTASPVASRHAIAQRDGRLRQEIARATQPRRGRARRSPRTPSAVRRNTSRRL